MNSEAGWGAVYLGQRWKWSCERYPDPGRPEWEEIMDLGGAPPRVDPNRRLKVPSEAIVRARRSRPEHDRELSRQALAAIAAAARRSREARVGPEPRTMRPAEPRTTRAPESPRSRPVEEAVAGTPDLPAGPQGSMAR